MHVSLTEQLENMVHERVASGMYSNASEVVREALRKYFNVSGENLTSQEIDRIRELVRPRLDALNHGDAVVLGVDEVFTDIEKDLAK